MRLELAGPRARSESLAGQPAHKVTVSRQATRLRAHCGVTQTTRKGPPATHGGPAHQAAVPHRGTWPRRDLGGLVHSLTPEAQPTPSQVPVSRGLPPARGSGQHSPGFLPGQRCFVQDPTGPALVTCGAGVLKDSRAPGGLFSRGPQGMGRALRPPGCPARRKQISSRPGPLPARPSPTQARPRPVPHMRPGVFPHSLQCKDGRHAVVARGRPGAEINQGAVLEEAALVAAA